MSCFTSCPVVIPCQPFKPARGLCPVSLLYRLNHTHLPVVSVMSRCYTVSTIHTCPWSLSCRVVIPSQPNTPARGLCCYTVLTIHTCLWSPVVIPCQPYTPARGLPLLYRLNHTHLPVVSVMSRCYTVSTIHTCPWSLCYTVSTIHTCPWSLSCPVVIPSQPYTPARGLCVIPSQPYTPARGLCHVPLLYRLNHTHLPVVSVSYRLNHTKLPVVSVLFRLNYTHLPVVSVLYRLNHTYLPVVSVMSRCYTVSTIHTRLWSLFFASRRPADGRDIHLHGGRATGTGTLPTEERGPHSAVRTSCSLGYVMRIKYFA
ncbi:hypothetical protein DPMN_118774 [Dreissena polymorpha]|uniref:Uncharacterized protein n=1 Tax=Dreissena polymorpha TaxID=45954 RepID=A0A9D4GI15_DREPO|nr:hypothetical protein DPMN_118774 [Dreissena polymorpha]